MDGLDRHDLLMDSDERKLQDGIFVNSSSLDVLRGRGRMEHGCPHYRRRCKIRAPCCDKVFDCRHCHNEAMAKEGNDLQFHEVPRHMVEEVICALCKTEQRVKQICEKCAVCMGEYFCEKCKFFDDDVSKGQFHCDACGICRVGGSDNFFHCERCGCCYAKSLQNGHSCVENSTQQNCPVCFEYLFDSVKDISVLRCGHTMHLQCLREMHRHSRYTCPTCSKSVCDMSKMWEQLDREIAATPMPETYQDKKVWILCNDCGVDSEVQFHIIAQKCHHCCSYNTRQIKGKGQSTSQ
ncbi:hypothetical protein KP509_07G088000 [Ceratopteris richardii]|uniref:Uncharacterized protein n=1 Tax=Ceratopteris richardii TaxID=49495 RepID=A0A8T2UH65_CERRI|nr:hypothetical protein KP509_07G088000 [Ceratopteris richardii]